MGNTTCLCDGCEKPYYAKGWCRHHYDRWWSTGDPLTPRGHGGKKSAAADVRPPWPQSPLTCVEWVGRRSKYGYGCVTIDGERMLVHRSTYIAISGLTPEVVRHTCDNPSCYRFEHLLPGTHADNVADRVARGRSATGTRNKGGRRSTPERT